MDPQTYLTQIKTKLVVSSFVVSIAVLEEYSLVDQGYFRARLQLSNSDFLEVAEYFVLEAGSCMTKRYRYQWMDESQRVLRKRWDNVEHFPELANFPHHVHVGEESQVEPGRRLSIVELLAVIEQEIGSSLNQN